MTPYDLNIRHLAAHAAIVRHGSVTDAARKIHLSQPAVTQAISKLETQLGERLFVRHPGGMEPTEAGQILAKRVEAMLRFVGKRLATSTQIKAFLALAQAGTYPAASQETGLSEASLHRAVADLGLTLGSPLFSRRGHSLMLTPKGRDSVRRFTLAMRELDSAFVEIASLAGREIGRIAIGAMPLSRSRLLPEAMIAFHSAHPDVQLSVVEGSHAELIGPLREGQIDLMLGALRDDPGPDLENIELFKDSPIIVGRTGHPLEGIAMPGGSDLAAFPWIMPGSGAPLRALWSRMFDNLHTPSPRVVIECGSVMTIRQLLLGTDHLTLLSADQVAVELDSGILTQIGPAQRSLDRTIGITTRLDWNPTPLQARFLSMLSTVGSFYINSDIRKN